MGYNIYIEEGLENNKNNKVLTTLIFPLDPKEFVSQLPESCAAHSIHFV